MRVWGVFALICIVGHCIAARGAKGLNISNHAEPRILLERRPVLPKAPPPNDAPRYITAPGELTGLDRLHWLHSHRHKQQQEASRRLHEARKAMPQRPRSMSCDAAGVCVFKGVQVSLQNKLGLLFCVDCPDPHAEGSYIDTWESRLFPAGFHVDSELIVGVPNDGSCPPLTPVGGTIVLYFRGNVPFITKVKHAQEAGALGVIIVDDGRCTETFECDRLLGSRRSKQYFAELDRTEDWDHVVIPAVLITRAQGQRLMSFLRLQSVDLDEHGRQVYVPDA